MIGDPQAPSSQDLDEPTIDADTIDGDGPSMVASLETFPPEGASRTEAMHAGPVDARTGMPLRYKDLGLIGRGGMGEVRRMVDRRLGHTVAVKILGARLVGVPAARARFLAEARLTARLRHPGIVAVFDRGELPDGRPWFAMTEVRGRELAAVMVGAGLWRKIDLLSRVCETMAYAHSQRVIHRDLKPSNIMVGAFGESLVMDWGLGRALDDLVEEDAEAVLTDEEQALSTLATRAGQVMGTPTYMPPEQAVGLLGLLSPASDVYALGAILYEMLSGVRPYEDSGDILAEVRLGPPAPLTTSAVAPAELVAICERAMARDIPDRYPDAGAMVSALQRWLTGEQRRERALALVAQASEQRPAIQQRRQEAARLRARARAYLGELDPWDSPHKKREGWDQQERAASLETEAAVREAEWLQTLRASLNLAPELPEAHDALAAHYHQRLLRAEEENRRSEAAQAVALLRSHDRGQYTAFLKGTGALTLHTDPPGATVECLQFVRNGRRMVATPQGTLGTTPLDDVVLPRGSYLLRITAPGREPVSYPVLIERGEHWDGVPPNATVPLPIWLPPAGTLGADECYIPAGWFWSGGDPSAVEALPARRLWIDAVVADRFPVSHARYLDFVNEQVAAGHHEAVRALVPRQRASDASEQMYARQEDGRYRLVEDEQGRCGPALPVVGISWHAACAFAQREGERTGRAWRLPNELEWEKAGRGVDRRFCPWGNHPEPGWSRVVGSLETSPAPARIDAHPEDCSVYGVRGLAGNVRDWCINVWKPGGPATAQGRVLLDAAAPTDGAFRAVRGGAWSSNPPSNRLAGRFVSPPDRWFVSLGLRLFRPAQETERS